MSSVDFNNMETTPYEGSVSDVDLDLLQLKDTTDTLQSRLENTEAKLRAVEHDHSMDLETALIKLEEVITTLCTA